MSNDFYKDLQRGRQAEVMVANAFRSMGYDVMDMTKNIKFWHDDIDLLIFDRDGTQHQFEVKGDWTIGRTDNVVLELTSKVGGDGWFITSKASHFAFVDMQNSVAYIARAGELRQHVLQKPDLLHVRLNGCECILLNINEAASIFQKVRL